jgi:hypothetical protein
MDPKKLVSHFSEFAVIFYAIYKLQQFAYTIGVTFLQFGPWKDFGLCNWALGVTGRRGLPKSGEAGGRGRAGAGRGGCRRV